MAIRVNFALSEQKTDQNISKKTKSKQSLNIFKIPSLVHFQLVFLKKRESETNLTLSSSIERETGIEPATLSLGSCIFYS